MYVVLYNNVTNPPAGGLVWRCGWWVVGELDTVGVALMRAVVQQQSVCGHCPSNRETHRKASGKLETTSSHFYRLMCMCLFHAGDEWILYLIHVTLQINTMICIFADWLRGCSCSRWTCCCASWCLFRIQASFKCFPHHTRLEYYT